MAQDEKSPDKLHPAAFENNCPVFLCCNQKYLAHSIAVIQSILAHGDSRSFYDFIIVHNGLTIESIQKVEKWMTRPNASIRFYTIDPTDYLEDRSPFVGKLSIETYFRVFAPQIFRNFTKILYLDSDLVIKGDISELFQADLGENLVGACRDNFIHDECRINPHTDRCRYINEVLGVQPSHYFNAGVLMFNLELMRRDNFMKLFWNESDRLDKPLLADQDILNSICRNRTFYFDDSWNVNAYFVDEREEHPYFSACSPEFVEWCRDIRKRVKLIHYTGKKPWNFDFIDYAGNEYWDVLRETPFYEEVIANRDTQASPSQLALSILRAMFQQCRCTTRLLFAPGSKAGRYRMRKRHAALVRKNLTRHLLRVLGMSNTSV